MSNTSRRVTGVAITVANLETGLVRTTQTNQYKVWDQLSAFEFLRNSSLDARNFFDVGGVPHFMHNQFGGSAGGPVLKDSLFYFGAYEGLWARKGATGNTTVPNAEARARAATPDVARFLQASPLANSNPVDALRGEFRSVTSEGVNENFYKARGD